MQDECDFNQWQSRRIPGGQEEGGGRVMGCSITWAVSAKGYRRESCIKYATVQIRMQGGGTGGSGGSQFLFSFKALRCDGSHFFSEGQIVLTFFLTRCDLTFSLCHFSAA